MSSVKEAIKIAMKESMLQRDKDRLEVIRIIMSEIKQVEVDERIDPDDVRVLVILDKMQKQRRESIRQFEDGGRFDLSEQKKKEMEIIQAFMPTPLSEEEISVLVAEALKESGATTARDMGKVMAILKPKLQGKADISVVGAKVKASLDN